ncbi:MAG: hypothetical protein H0T89_01845 [Deltaproteobacteria bacterium]|nr:hypothetical protein [Deltaproteobacteria bacterium]MDQ3300599.1 hypothetical protein [Myxococcota bacterium]
MKKLALLVLVLGACSKTESTDIRTSGIYASITASTLGDGTTNVSTTLFLGNPINLNFVELAGEDELLASHAGMEKVMVESDLFNVVSYRAQFQTDAEGEQFEVAFLRGDDVSAPSSIATLPAKFTLGAGPASAARSTALAVSWSPAGSTDAMSWVAEGDCIERASGTFAGDTGTGAIAAGTIMKRDNQQVADSCEVTLSVSRSRLGEVDVHYGKGGYIAGVQTRQLMFTSMP